MSPVSKKSVKKVLKKTARKTVKKSTSSKKLNKLLTVVIPAYNEEDMIKNAIVELKKIKSKINNAGFNFKILVVNDGSKDRTLELARSAGADEIVNHKVNKGLGAAIRSGLRAARDLGSDIAVKFDADLQHDPEDILELIKPIVNDESDIVYGRRFDRIEYKMPFVRRTGNIIFSTIMKILTGWPIKDSQPGIFAVNSDYLAVFRLPGDYNYTQQVLLDAFHNGMRFSHVSVRFKKRETGRSFVSLKYPFKVSYQILVLILSFKPMRIFGSIGLFMLLGAAALFGTELTRFFMELNPKPVVHVNAVLGLGLTGIQFLFFGLLAELIVVIDRKRG